MKYVESNRTWLVTFSIILTYYLTTIVYIIDFFDEKGRIYQFSVFGGQTTP